MALLPTGDPEEQLTKWVERIGGVLSLLAISLLLLMSLAME